MKKSPYRIFGMVFAAIAAAEVIATATLLAVGIPNVGLVILPFVIQIPVFGGIGLGFLAYHHRKVALRERLIANGYYEAATIVAIEQNLYVRVNRCHPYYVVCRIERDGVLHEYRSEGYYAHPGVQLGDSVPVYLDRQNEKHYYVDVDSIAPVIVRH